MQLFVNFSAKRRAPEARTLNVELRTPNAELQAGRLLGCVALAQKAHPARTPRRMHGLGGDECDLSAEALAKAEASMPDHRILFSNTNHFHRGGNHSFTPAICHSERSEESNLASPTEPHWILRCAQNDRKEYAPI
jgi:hypothetical protein